MMSSQSTQPSASSKSNASSSPSTRLTRRCKRALLSAALSTGVATRRRVRKAIRVFLRRHGHRRDYLARVASRVAANAALAIALLGLGAQTARAAGMPVFDPFAVNPFAGQLTSFAYGAATADLDGDGDPDFVLSQGYAAIPLRYFENTGSALVPAVTERFGAQNPFGPTNGTLAAPLPTFADLDDDGDQDLILGAADFGSTLLYFRNSGDRTAPAFVKLTGSANPLANVTNSRLIPTFGDLDQDGDLDLVLGGGPVAIELGLLYYENTGTAQQPAFALQTGAASPVEGLVAGAGYFSLSMLSLGDLDRDGDLDLVSGDPATGNFLTFRNTGSATTPRFASMPAKSNPFFGESMGSRSTPALVDLDADGDLDLIAGGGLTGIHAFENKTGQFVTSNDVGPQAFPPNTAGAIPLADFDGDGDLSVYASSHLSGTTTCTFFDNAGSATDTNFFASSLPGFAPFPSSACSNPPPFSFDIDRDGDFDLLSSVSLRINSGTPNSPSMAAPITFLTPTLPPPWDPGFPVGSPGFSTFGDLDGDDDLDALAPFYGFIGGQIRGHLFFFENTGSATSPSFIERPLTSASLPDPSDFALPGYVPRYLVNFDGDDDMDIVEGSLTTPVTFSPTSPYWENVGTSSSPAWQLHLWNQPRHPFPALLALANHAVPSHPISFADLDGDGDVDGFSSRATAPFPALTPEVVFLENSLFRGRPRFGTLSSLRFNGLDTGSFSTLASADLDGDGDPDFIASDSFGSGTIRYYQNIGTSLLPAISERTGAANPFTGLGSSWTPNMNLGDLDADGDFDLLIGQAYYGEPMRYLENTGTSTTPAFVVRAGGANPVAGVNGSRPAPALGDLDSDGDLDLVVGLGYGTFRYFRNMGSATSPAFSETFGPANPLDGLIAGVGFIANPALGDIDRDGDLDLVVGDEPTGGFHYFENTGSAIAPAFVSRMGASNPFDGQSVGLNSTPVLVDLNADGQLDLVSGERDGNFNVSVVPEPARGLLASAGALFLGWLGRRRRGIE